MNSKLPSLAPANISFFDAHPAPDDCHKDILAGLLAEPKTLDPKWFYDAEGSALFELITALPEYYPTRTEVSILKAQRDSIAAYCGQGSVLIEPGAGNCAKARLLLDAIKPACIRASGYLCRFSFQRGAGDCGGLSLALGKCTLR
jgi:uncharacterized SAM-dependent methyltransferase